MVFSSLVFMYVFLPIVLILYFISPVKVKNLILLVSGLIFYAWGEPKYIWIMVISSFVDYFAGCIMDIYDKNPKVRKMALVTSMIVDLGFLFVFKYSGFFIGNINALFGTSFKDPNLPLPIGISFYTFQSMSYTIDLYWRKIKVQKNFLNFLSYVSLFPQLVAGPIVRYEDVQNEIDNRAVNINLTGEGVAIFIKGLTKKILLANNIGSLWTSIKALDYSTMSAGTAWLGILSFTFQIYFDFSGYSDMAIGLGKMLGFNFPINFDHPYMSKSISEFWRRWHITLGSWFRNYIYIPLGGNRKGKFRTLVNLMVVWAATGFWHGASWNFIFWGVYFGVLIIIERLGWGKILEKLPPFVSTLYTFILVVFGWVFFDIEGFGNACNYVGAMFGAGGSFIDSYAKYQLGSYFIIFMFCIIASTDWVSKFITGIRKNPKTSKFYMTAAPVVQAVLMLISTAYLVDATYNPFLYFRF